MSSVAQSWLSILSPDVTLPRIHVGKGKYLLKAMTVVPGDLLHIIGEEGATDLQSTEAVRSFFPAMYKRRGAAYLNKARCEIYQKHTKNSTEDTISHKAHRSPPWTVCPSTGAALESSRPPCTTCGGHHRVWKEGGREGGRGSHHARPGCKPRCSSCPLGNDQL